MSASLVLLSAEVLTMSAAVPRAQAVAIKDDSIIAVGSDHDISAYIGPRTRVIECRGQCLLPGFHDAHLHLMASAAKLLSVDCGPTAVSGIADIQEAIRQRTAGLPSGTWIRAGDYDEFQLAEQRHPTRWDLDRAAPNHPVRLQHRSHHAGVLNSMALRLAGIERGASPDGRGVVETDDRTGEPTGLLIDMQGYLNDRVIPQLSPAEVGMAMDRVGEDLLSRGITSVQDASYRNGPSDWLALREHLAAGRPQPRVTLMVGCGHRAEFAELGLAYGSGDQRLRVGPVKIMLTESGGDFAPSAESLFEYVWQAHVTGWPVAIHVVEESTVCLATEAIAAALERRPRTKHGHRLEHVSIAPPPLLDRLAEVGLGVATQPGFLYHSGDRYLAEVDEHLRQWLYPFKSMLDRGLVVAAGSDAPVAPADALRSIGAAVHRRSRRGQAVGAAERVSIGQALGMHTIGPARLVGRAAELGSIAPGKLADLVLLEGNPLEMPDEASGEIKVETTILGGQVVWDRPEREKSGETKDA